MQVCMADSPVFPREEEFVQSATGDPRALKKEEAACLDVCLERVTCALYLHLLRQIGAVHLALAMCECKFVCIVCWE